MVFQLRNLCFGQMMKFKTLSFIFQIRCSVMNEKVQLLEASIELLKEKFKANDFSKSNLQNRVSSIQSRISIIVNGSSKVQKENLTNLDLQLSNSQVFASSLKKMDANVTSNLRRLESHFSDSLRESQSKFCEIEQKMLGMLTQKQKILRNLSFQVQNQAHSIAAIEQWIKSDHQHINSIHLVEENVRQKVELMQKNADMRGEILMEKIRFLEQLQESVVSNFKGFGSKYEEFDQKLKAFKREAKKEFMEIQEKFDNKFEKYGNETNEKMLKFNANSQPKRQSKDSDQEESLIEVKKKLKNYANKFDDNDEKIAKINKKMTFLEQKIQNLAKDMVSNQQRTQNRNKTISNQTQRIFSSAQQKPTFEDMNYSSKRAKQQKQADRFVKKELPPRRNLFQQHLSSQNNEQERIPETRGGIRGLLQKSKDKDKQRQGLLKTNDPLGRKQQTSSRKGLPPVKQDPSTKKKKESQGNKYQNQAQEDTTVYQIDQQGYLMDQEGNYLLDETGEMIRLSPEQVREYMMEQQY